MRRSLKLATALLAILALIGPLDCFSSTLFALSPQTDDCCLGPDCVPTANSDNCCLRNDAASVAPAPQVQEDSGSLALSPATGTAALLPPVAAEVSFARATSRTPRSTIRSLQLPLLI